MSIAIEYLNLVVPIKAIESNYSGGWMRFCEDKGISFSDPDPAVADGELLRVGGMTRSALVMAEGDMIDMGLEGWTAISGEGRWKDYCIFSDLQSIEDTCSWLLAGDVPGTVRLALVNTEMYQNPTPEDQHTFLLGLYFSNKGHELPRCISRAYLDFNRTLHGIKRPPTLPSSLATASALLEQKIHSLQAIAATTTQDSFDKWHRETCDALCSEYLKNGYPNFHIGQAQKWINMTLKYVYVFGEGRLPGYLPLYSFCHIPIDNVILGVDSFRALRTFTGAWSRISDYEKYLEFQVAVRERFKGSSPLAVEFTNWQSSNAS